MPCQSIGTMPGSLISRHLMSPMEIAWLLICVDFPLHLLLSSFSTCIISPSSPALQCQCIHCYDSLSFLNGLRKIAMRYDSCRQCTKRRIKCDKATPQCLKCSRKGIECSGVGKTYKFAANLTPDAVETSLRAKDRKEELQQGDLNAQCNATSITATTGLSPDAESIIGENLDDDDDDDDETEVGQCTEVELYSKHVTSGQQAYQPSRYAVAHRDNIYRLRHSLEMQKPEQIILLNHCKFTILACYHCTCALDRATDDQP